MTDTQLFMAVGLPSFVAMVGILVNVGYFVAMNTRMGRLEDKFDSILRVEERLGIK